LLLDANGAAIIIIMLSIVLSQIKAFLPDWPDWCVHPFVALSKLDNHRA
jgi:hypothetical protein